jgi:putative membrane protein
MKNTRDSTKGIHISMLIVFAFVLIWSYIDAYTLFTWFFEALPAMLIVGVLVATYKRFTFTTFVYSVVLVHMIVLLVGSKYTYERNPLFDYLMESMDLSRNHFDRVGHFFQGLMPAFMAKELLLRAGYLKRSKMFYLIVISMVLGFSAFYELLEFTALKVTGIPGSVILSYQGDEWDTQWDMTMALSGGIIALGVFGKAHDRWISKIEG